MEFEQRLREPDPFPGLTVLSRQMRGVFATDLLPEHCVYSDFYVFPKNMAWTMAFTHEDGWIGSYFAKHPDYDALNAKNIARIRKNKDIKE